MERSTDVGRGRRFAGRSPGALLALALAATLGACEGVLFDGPAGPRHRGGGGPSLDAATPVLPGDDACAGASPGPVASPLRRLSSVEYGRTLAALFPGEVVDASPMPADPSVEGFANDARTLGPSDLLVARWEEAARLYAAAVTATPARLSAFLPCAREGLDDAAASACAGALVDGFGRRVLRRPLTTEERAVRVEACVAQRASIDVAAAVELGVYALLVSPSFLYRIERPAATPGERLDAFELATRLSYFLWQTAPDDALLDAAARGDLDDDAGLDATLERMLSDPRAREGLVELHREWLDFDRLLADEHARRTAPSVTAWTPALRAAARAEQGRLVERVIFDGEGTLESLLTSTDAEVNASLAALYGVPGPADDDTWVAASLPEGERAGLLTRAGFLASHAHAGNGSPPLRGVFVRERFFCEARVSPPAAANLAPPVNPEGAPPATNRALFAERTAAPSCQGCHVRIDPVGFGFEHYDALGAFRDVDQGLPVDASGSLFGTDADAPFENAVELSARLAASPAVRACVASKWLRFATGAAPSAADACLRQRLAARLTAGGGHLLDLARAIATAPEWRLRARLDE